MTHLPLVLAAVLLAALVQGVAGFAFGILSMAVLVLLWDPRTANVVVTLLSLATSLIAIWSVRRHCRWRRLAPMFGGVVLGLPLGTLLLVQPGAGRALRLLVALGCVLVAQQNWPRPRAVLASDERPLLGWLGGLAGGFLSGAVSAGGPPILWYVYRHDWPREELKASTLLVFATATVLKLGFWVGHDLSVGDPLLTRQRCLVALLLLPAGAIGSLVGSWLFDRISRDQLRRGVCLLLLVMAVMTTFTALR